jgi:hypothetical protein
MYAACASQIDDTDTTSTEIDLSFFFFVKPLLFGVPVLVAIQVFIPVNFIVVNILGTKQVNSEMPVSSIYRLASRSP